MTSRGDRSIQTLYGSRFGISLPVAYSLAMADTNVDDETDWEDFMHWFLAITHVIAGTLQLMCCVRDRKVRAAVPAWLGRELDALFKRVHPLENPTAAWKESYMQHKSKTLEDCFGLRPFSPDEHPVGIMNMKVKLAKQLLPPSPRLDKTHPAEMVVEQFMLSLSQVRVFLSNVLVPTLTVSASQGMGLCLAARAASVRVTSDRKRKNQDTNSNGGGSSDEEESSDSEQ